MSYIRQRGFPRYTIKIEMNDEEDIKLPDTVKMYAEMNYTK